MRILIIMATLVMIASSAFAVEMRVGPPTVVDWGDNDRIQYLCDTDVMDSGMYQDNLTVYGNAFDLVSAGLLNNIEFWHYAWGELVGPYDYMIYVYDVLTCTVICEIGPLQAADAIDDHVMESVDLTSYGCLVSGNIFVGIQPMALSDYGYYHPTLDFEYLPVDNCMRQVDIGTSSGCDVPLDNGDNLLRIIVDDTTPIFGLSFSTVKALY